jgi:hypothetical protein
MTMNRTLYCLMFCGLLLFTGCDKDKPEKAEAQKAAAAETAKAVAASNKRDMEAADALVQKWINKLQPTKDGEFVKHEGLTEVDPWNNYIRVTHEKQDSKETLEVRSAGADSQFHTEDDLVRTRERTVSSGFPSGWVAFLGLWLVLGVIALIISNSRRSNAAPVAPQVQDPDTVWRTNAPRRGVVESSALIAMGGLALVGTLLSWICGCGTSSSSAATVAANVDENRRRNGWDCAPCDCAPCDCCIACDPSCGGACCNACDSAHCGHCDAPDCSACGHGCDCGGCDCGGCDCGGCDC